jgi:hypothetical protein
MPRYTHPLGGFGFGLLRVADWPTLDVYNKLDLSQEFSAAKTKKPPATVTKKVFSWMSSTVTQQLSPAVVRALSALSLQFDRPLSLSPPPCA